MAQRARIEKLGELRRRIEEQQRVVESPRAVVERTEAGIGAGMEREPERPVVAPARAKFVNLPPFGSIRARARGELPKERTPTLRLEQLPKDRAIKQRSTRHRA